MRALLLAATAAALVAGACTSGPPAPVDTQAYVKQIAEARAIKDKTFREEPEPIPRDKVDVFLPLRYYPPDPSYAAPAELKLANQRPVFEMPTSTGTLRRMERVGVLEFSLHGQPMSLAAFVGKLQFRRRGVGRVGRVVPKRQQILHLVSGDRFRLLAEGLVLDRAGFEDLLHVRLRIDRGRRAGRAGAGHEGRGRGRQEQGSHQLKGYPRSVTASAS